MLDDRALVEGSLHGDAEAFAELVRRYQAPLLASAYHLLGHAEDAQDLAQETFIEAFRHLSTLREGEKLRGWLFTILRHKCLHFLRERRRVDVPLEMVEDSLAAPAPALTGQEVWYALQRLPLSYREILAARYLQELSFAEIAVVLGISEHTAVVRCARARARLRDIIREMDEEETRALMRRAMGALPAGLMGEAFLHQVLQEVTPLMHTPAPAAPSSLPTAPVPAAKQTLATHLLVQAAGWKAAAVTAVAVTVIGAALFVAPRLARPGRTTIGALAMTMPAAAAPVDPPTVRPPAPPAPAPLLLAAAPGTPAKNRSVSAKKITPASANARADSSFIKLTGKVVDDDGKPIAGASIHIDLFAEIFAENGAPKESRDLLSDRDGIFSLHVPPASWWSDNPGNITVCASGYGWAHETLTTQGMVLTLHAGASIGGTVVDAVGKPLAGVPVRLTGWWYHVYSNDPANMINISSEVPEDLAETLHRRHHGRRRMVSVQRPARWLALAVAR